MKDTTATSSDASRMDLLLTVTIFLIIFEMLAVNMDLPTESIYIISDVPHQGCSQVVIHLKMRKMVQLVFYLCSG